MLITVHVNLDCESFAKEFLEIASEQRLGILLRLNEKKSKVGIVAKELGASMPYVFRDFERLVKAGLITKDSDGDYDITTYGKIICGQIPSIRFLSNNKTFFKNHGIGDIPSKFLQRIGSLEDGKHIKGFVKVMEKWKEIHENAEEYVENILYEVTYSADFVEPLFKKVESGVKLRSILSESAIMSKERKQMFDKLGIKKLIDKGLVERKMKNSVSVVMMLNEKEGCIMFPNKADEPDLSEGFYGNSSSFQDWCHDYFNYCWNNATAFQENKLKKD
jgi:predicted transcriptional regulator